MKRIATHKQPDADALASAWLASRFLFAGEASEVAFVSRGAGHIQADCVVDVGNEYDPTRLRFDHKPPAFSDRNASCATRLLWEYLVERGDAVGYLADFVAVVHEGDANPPRSVSVALRESRTNGYHAAVSAARRTNPGNDATPWEAISLWLDERHGATST